MCFLSLTPVAKAFFISGLNAFFVTRAASLVTALSWPGSHTTNHCLLFSHRDLTCHLSLSPREEFLSSADIPHLSCNVSFRNAFQTELLVHPPLCLILVARRNDFVSVARAFVGKKTIMSTPSLYSQCPWFAHLCAYGSCSFLVPARASFTCARLSQSVALGFSMALLCSPCVPDKVYELMEVRYLEACIYSRLQLRPRRGHATQAWRTRVKSCAWSHMSVNPALERPCGRRDCWLANLYKPLNAGSEIDPISENKCGE